MHYALYLLAASWMTGAPPAIPNDTTPPASSATAQPAGSDNKTDAPRGKFRERLRKLFHHDDYDDGPSTYNPPYSPTLNPSGTSSGWGTAPKTGASATPSSIQRASIRPTQAHFELTKQEEQKVGHEKDYAWITGKLFRAPGSSDRWVLRYAGQYEVDRYDGAVLLNSSPQLASFREGDFVCVQGKVVENSSAKPHAGAAYDVTAAYLIEHGAH